jgi:hypothetical protein
MGIAFSVHRCAGGINNLALKGGVLNPSARIKNPGVLTGDSSLPNTPAFSGFKEKKI